MTLLVRDHGSSAAYAPAADAWSWRDDAACRGMTPEESARVFFPEADSDRSVMYLEARGYCDRCPVVDECLAEAYELNDRDGFRGGMSAGERIRRRARLTFVGTCHECGCSFAKPTRRSRFCGPVCLNREHARRTRMSRAKAFG